MITIDLSTLYAITSSAKLVALSRSEAEAQRLATFYLATSREPLLADTWIV